MALRRCRECTTTFAVGLPACPHCRSTDHEEDGAMPKITRHGGPTIAGAAVVGGAWTDEGEPNVWPEPEQEEGGEESSPGSSSSASDEKPSTGREAKPSSRRKPVRTTASRSTKGQTENSSAPSTDGDQETDTSAADAE